MKIKPRPGVTKKQKAYLKWMGLDKPRTNGRLGQLNKFVRSRRTKSEFVRMAEYLEPQAQPIL